jgi:hypothetical protein
MCGDSHYHSKQTGGHGRAECLKHQQFGLMISRQLPADFQKKGRGEAGPQAISNHVQLIRI